MLGGCLVAAQNRPNVAHRKVIGLFATECGPQYPKLAEERMTRSRTTNAAGGRYDLLSLIRAPDGFMVVLLLRRPQHHLTCDGTGGTNRCTPAAAR